MDVYWNHNSAFHPEILQRARAVHGDVLDVGCGEGLLVQRLAPVSRSVTGIGPDPSALARARARLASLPAEQARRARLVEGDFLTDTGPHPGGFDLITCVAALHHMPLGACLRQKMAALLRPGGQLVVVGCAANVSPADWALSGLLLVPIRVSGLPHGPRAVGPSRLLRLARQPADRPGLAVAPRHPAGSVTAADRYFIAVSRLTARIRSDNGRIRGRGEFWQRGPEMSDDVVAADDRVHDESLPLVAPQPGPVHPLLEAWALWLLDQDASWLAINASLAALSCDAGNPALRELAGLSPGAGGGRIGVLVAQSLHSLDVPCEQMTVSEARLIALHRFAGQVLGADMPVEFLSSWAADGISWRPSALNRAVGELDALVGAGRTSGQQLEPTRAAVQRIQDILGDPAEKWLACHPPRVR